MKDIKFIRYGGLSAVKQTHYISDKDPDKGFHNPPTKRGLYAMVKGYEELFLIGSTSVPNHISGKTQWLKDDDGNLMKDDRTWDGDINVRFGAVCSPELKKLLKKRGIKENQLLSTQKRKGSKPECPDDDIECEDCKFEKDCHSPFYLSILKAPRVFTYKGELWHHLEETTEHNQILNRSGDWIKTTYNSFIKAFNKNKHNHLKDYHTDFYKKGDFENDGKDPFRNTRMTYNRDHLEVFIEKL